MIDYESSGVNLQAADSIKAQILRLVASTYTDSVITKGNEFAGIIRIGDTDEAIVVSVDGVGTKLLVAIMMGLNNTVGEDLVNHCVNDIAVTGCDPLCFVDYISIGKVDEKVILEIIKGLTRGCSNNGVPLVGSHMSALANHAWHGWHGTAYRTGFSTRNILGMEWVLPTGDILLTGSLAAPGAGNFWGEGPGPDLKNLRKGIVGDNGSMGIITRMAIKLHPWPGPRFLPTEGIRPRKKCELPTNRFKWYFINYPTEKELIDAMYEIGKAEVGGNMERYDSQRLAYEYAKSRDEYWGLLIEGHWQQYPNTIAICLWGFASEKQLEYEEKVLNQIIDETGGKLWPEEVFQQFVPYVANTKIRSIWGPRWCRNGGSMQTGWLVMDSLDEVLSYTPTVWEHMSKYTPPYLEGHGNSAWVLPFDFCHFGGADNAPPFEKTEEIARSVLAEAMEQMATDTKAGKTTFELATAPANVMGPSFSNFHRPLAKIKKAFDPGNVSNPTRFIDIAAMEREEKEKAASS